MLEHVVAAYDELGYELVELPQASVEDRAGFVCEKIQRLISRGKTA